MPKPDLLTVLTMKKSPASLVAALGIYVATATFVSTVAAQSSSALNAYFDNLSSVCGSQFVGEMTFPTEGQDSFMGKRLVADFQQCSGEEIRVPFAVGDDTSRTWVFSRSDKSLVLKHDHRHPDGTPDEITDYGGEADNSGSALSQSFPADAHTQALIPEASSNVWMISLSEDKTQLTYHLERHGKPRFTAVLVKTP